MSVTAITIEKTLDNGNVVVTISHDGQGCPNAKAARLHVHENLLATPQAGSDPVNQTNTNFQIGSDFGTSVTVPLMAAIPGKCFVQVDASSGTIRRGRFFPTATCPSETSPATSSAPPSSSTPPSSSSCTVVPVPGQIAPAAAACTSAASSSTPPPPSHGVSSASTSRDAPPTHTPNDGPQLASTGVSGVGRGIGLATLLLGVGIWLSALGRPARRHH